VGAFTEADVSTLQILADQLANAIDNARQYKELEQTKGLVGARTALAWMGMTSSAWRHTTGNQAQSIVEQVDLLRNDLIQIAPEIRYPEVYNRLSDIQDSAIQIGEKPITPPLSIEEGTISVPINELVKLRAKQLQAREPYQSVTIDFDFILSDEATVRASPEWLRRALDIVIDNAVDTVIDTSNRRLTITTNQKDKKVEIRLIDTGKGIPENIRPLLFRKPIKKSKGSEGLGMGLLIAQAIIHTYGGEIIVESTGQQGTTMLICLPLEA
jgi:two-component system NtrC family sensor kinase